MEKEKEEERFIWYKFFTGVAEEAYFDEGGRKRYRIYTKFGVLKFDKTNWKIELIKEKTDPHFFTTKRYETFLLVKMRKCARENHYPERTCIATG